MLRLNRRDFLTCAAAAIAVPSHAQSLVWESVFAEANQFDQCHALVIKQADAPIVSRVFRGPSIDRFVPIKSVSKTIVAALTGAALERGEIPSLDATLADIAPQLIPKTADPRVNLITIEHLVTMQAGLERTSGANYGNWTSSANWVSDALTRPIVAQPGSRMLYSTGSFHVLGAVLSEVSGQSLLVLARRRLGRPLGIDFPAWTRDPQGRYLGGNEMAMSPLDMIKFGKVYLHGGVSEEERILSPSWVKHSLTPKTRSPFSGLAYGYGWFLGRSGGDDYALARGYGGQVICIVPSLELVVAITSDPTRPARSGGYFGALLALIERRIIPTARGEAVL